MDFAPLTPLYERPGPWASAYLDTSFADEATLSRRELKGRQTSEELAAQGADEETCRAVRRAIGSYAYGQTPGRAVFAAHGEVVFEPVLALPPPDESSAVWGPLPHVAPLPELTPDEPDTLVVGSTGPAPTSHSVRPPAAAPRARSRAATRPPPTGPSATSS
ncbi:hypothetical protein [Streptomyces sp. NPDC057552]|uniref:hypothetical protein n=1 Tax=Streptomyces sp. NPDC057552 TaxID=3350537 RepID=UPI003688D61C